MPAEIYTRVLIRDLFDFSKNRSPAARIRAVTIIF